MKTILTAFFIASILNISNAQIPKGGTYTYKVAFAEWGGKSLGTTCTVVLKKDSVFVYNDGSLSGKKGELIESGIIVMHKSGQWIIANRKEDAELDEFGGCSEGPRVIDLKKMVWWTY